MAENMGENMTIMRRLALAALVLDMLAGFVLVRLSIQADWFGMERMVRVCLGLWALAAVVLLAGLVMKRRQARQVCAAGLVLFMAAAAGAAGASWFSGHGQWRLGGELSQRNVTRVALGYWYGRDMARDLAAEFPELAYMLEWDASVTLSEEEQQQAIELLRRFKVKNPAVNSVLWDTPPGLPEIEGEGTDPLVFYYGDDKELDVLVHYPYVDNYVAADLEACRELEQFIRGLRLKYAAQMAIYDASWDIFNTRFNEELQQWHQNKTETE